MSEQNLTQGAFRAGVATLASGTFRTIDEKHLPVWYESFSGCTDEDFVEGCKLFVTHIGGWLEIKSVWDGITMHRERPRSRPTAAQAAYFEQKRKELAANAG